MAASNDSVTPGKFPLTTHCGHAVAQFVRGDEGTSYCPACEDDAQHSEWVAEQREWDETELPDENFHV